jgi:general secretion pathway protein J
MWRHNKNNSQSGFTLIEVLVSIAIFSVISAGVYRVLSAMVATQESVVSHSESLHDIQQAMWIMSADIEQVVMRDVGDDSRRRQSAMSSEEDDYLLQFTRQGLRNPLLFNRSDLQRVAYSLGDDPDDSGRDGKRNSDATARKRSDKKSQHLLRHTWGAVDRVADTQEIVQVLLPDVEEMNVEFMNQEGKWLQRWPEKKLNDREHGRELPVAIKIELETIKYGTINRFFQIGNVIEKKKERQQ